MGQATTTLMMKTLSSLKTTRDARVHLASFGLSGDGHKTRKPTLYYSVLARADEGRILPIHFPISDFMLLFFPRVFQFLSSRERNWQEQQENPNGLGK